MSVIYLLKIRLLQDPITIVFNRSIVTDVSWVVIISELTSVVYSIEEFTRFVVREIQVTHSLSRSNFY